MKIEPLKDNMHFFNKVAEMKFQEFSYLTVNETIEDYLQRQKIYVTTELIPRAFVVLNDARELIGTFALKLKDFDSRIDLSPWLGSVVVSKNHRCKGVGAFIVSQAEEMARNLGYSQLYLYTPDKESWYAKQDWKVIERSFSDKYPVTVMHKELTLE